MRRRLLALLTLGAVLAGLAVAGCGSSSAGAPANPTATSLSYFPSQTPFVITLATKPSASAKAEEQQLRAKLPQLGFAQAALMSKAQQLGINFNQDIRPLYANPIVFGDDSTSLNAFQDHFLAVWVTNDAGKLNALIKKGGHMQSAGSHDGAKLYTTAGGGALAVTGATVLLAKTTADLTAALDRHAAGGGITESQYSSAVSGLPQDAAIHLYGNLAAVLSTPKAAQARRVPWVAALRSYGATFGYSTSGVTIQFRLDTGGAALSPAQLPFAGGTTPAAVVNGLPVQVGLRDPSQVITFILGAVQAASPHSYAHYLKQADTFKRKTGVDVPSLASQFQGDLVVDSDTHTTLLRAGVTDPAQVAKVLNKAAAANGGGGPDKVRALGGGFYHLTESGREGLVALIGNQFVFGLAPKGGQLQPATLRAFASAPGAPIPGASGAFSFRLSLPQLLAITGAAAANPNPLAHEILGLLDDFSGSMTASAAALTGTATLALK
jgi:hypothetical protein